ncbi:putative DEAD-box ATP-dependent RNA helicase family protein [Carex littledalei]|uniref:Putative DEAD-box ATP-dependent RNA helicase family protein n=1 Tax=Carex littledalei TaxID=544730 RepID=A0A833VEU5_9POAL|nr:putative DEAD-box ATP-dependent RNA helicase family protein [Carex littledalei]
MSFAPLCHLLPAPAPASASASVSASVTATSFLCCRKQKERGKGIATCTGNASSGSKSTAPSQAEERYQRVKMENAGAYRLIDRHTGHQVIVWGGAHDPDSPIPSHLLQSMPEPQAPGPSRAAPPVNASGFSKLKAQKVKSLIHKFSSSHPKSPSPSQSRIQVKSGVSKPIRVNKPLVASHDNYDDDEDDDENENGYEHTSSDEDYSDDDSPTINVRNSSANRSTSSGDTALFSTRAGTGTERGRGSRAGAAGASSLRGWGGVSSADYYSYSFDRKKLPRKSLANARGGFFSKTSFKNMGCTDNMITALRSLAFIRPSHIQAMAFRAVLQGKSCVIADHSGSGKTLAYLCPIIQRLRQDEEAALAEGKSAKSLARPGCPRVIVLAPTAELASQVLNNCRLISKSGIPFRSMVATGGFKQKTQLDTLDQGLDVLIATPGRFLYLYQQGFVQLSHLQCVVLDEVDILYGEEGFEQVLQSLVGAAPVSVQYVFVTATLPLEIYNKVVEFFPDCEVIMGPGVHRTSSGLEEVLVDCSGDANEEKNPETAFTNKKNALLKLVHESPVRKTIVFCNKIETCRRVENVLKRVDRKEARIRVLPFHAALAQDARLTNLKEFLKSQSADSMASRGIDFEKVDHVVLFDFPREPSEYVRRVGRTARGAGGAGKAYIFAVGKQVSLAGRIIERNQKGHPLHDVPGAYELDRY